jgi:putative FmdB family regulatory protein
MPIYAYRCAACGHSKDVLRKLSDAPLTVCPACGEPRFEKQVTAAGFQLKGSGWYVTDFRDGAAKKAAKAGDASSEPKAETPAAADGGTPAPAPATSAAPAAAAAPVTAPAAAPPPTSSSS